MKRQTGLDQLPNETILEILSHIYISDPLRLIKERSPLNKWIKLVTICSRRLRQVALPLLYRTAAIFTAKQLDGMLIQMINAPELAVYVKQLTIHEIREQSETTHRGDYGNIFTEEAQNRHLTGVFGGKLGLKGQDDDVRACFLIHLLPKLEELSVNLAHNSNMHSYSTYLVNLMDRQLLSTSLRSWERGDKTFGSSSFYTLDLVRVLLYLPIKTIKAHNVSSDRLFHRLDKRWARLPPKYSQSNVHTIELYRSCIGTEDLTDILRLPRGLKKFVYYDGRLDSNVPEESPRIGLGRALGRVARTLEVLGVLWSEYQESIISKTGSAVFSLQNFKALRILSISFSVLTNCANHGPAQSATEGVPLSDLLPPFLETLIAYPPTSYHWSKENYFDCVRSILQDKSLTCLPHLRTITCRAQGTSLPQGLIELAHTCDVNIMLDAN